MVGELLPNGYDFHHVPRTNGRTGGGVGIVFKTELSLKVTSSSASDANTSQFEYINCCTDNKCATIRFVVVYRPPTSTRNGLKTSTFFDEWTCFIEHLSIDHNNIIIVGDVNFHLDVDSNHDARKFKDSLATCGFVQHVNEPTHQKGHTLDVVITKDLKDIIGKLEVTDPVLCDKAGNISGDHYAISFLTQMVNPHPQRRTVNFRKLRAIDVNSFKQCIHQNAKLQEVDIPLDDLVANYNSSLKDIIDLQAPLLNRTITLRPHAPWYSAELRDAKHKRRQLERRWRSTKLEVHHQLYRDYCVVVNRLLCSTKLTYYETQIEQCPHNSKAMFRTVNMLMDNKGGCPLPSHTSDLQLASDFSDFFTSKVSTIRESLNHEDTPSFVPPLDDDATATLHSFTPTTIEEIVRIIKLSPNKSCELDPLPTWLLKLCVQELAPIIAAIVNKSLETSCMPAELKRAHVRPRLKKPCLDPDVLNNYRPVSNLPFISKIIEKVVDARLENHLRENDLHEPLQSAYRKHHSTETALIKIQSDILQALDNGRIAALVLLDLSAAFDTIDHSILTERLHKSFGITGDALTWIISYLRQRNQQVVIGNTPSDDVTIEYGIPQGSVLGPKLYSLYTKPLGDVIRHHQLDMHFYADDTQLYVSFENNAPEKRSTAVTRLNTCIGDIHKWLANNMLKLNDDKTEVILFTSKHALKSHPSVAVTVGEQHVRPATSIRNLGVIYDQPLSMIQHVNSVCRVGYMHVRNIGRIRRYLTEDATKTMIHALVTSRLDYCNALLYGLPASVTNKMQRLQNTCARMITRTRRSDHITPVLIKLHWLPVRRRIEYKMLSHTYRAINRQAPQYLCDMLSLYQPARALRSQSTLTLAVPRARTKTYGDRCFPKAAALLWNSLPASLRDTNSIASFQRGLKTFLFRQEFDNAL